MSRFYKFLPLSSVDEWWQKIQADGHLEEVLENEPELTRSDLTLV